MAFKRERDYDDYVPRAPSKRPKVNPDLVRIWEKLADDSEEIRLEAASDLISNHFASADTQTAQKLLERLFRGLCSGRKSARPGFYTALVGVLSQRRQYASSLDFSLSKILPVLEAQTTAEAETSKQDDRDHHFGKLLGIKAIVESGLLLQASDAEWTTVLDMLFGLMALKSWLRVEASVVACSCIQWLMEQPDTSDQRLLHMLRQLKKHKLVRTSDGLSIWLLAMDLLPKSKLPQDSWKMGNPLNSAELQSLKRTLLDKKQSEENADDDEMMGTSVWSPRLNLAWHYILKRLGRQQAKNEISFEDFWREVVENGLFLPSSTPERKLLGLLVLKIALRDVKPSLLRMCFSRNIIATITQALRSTDEAYLRKSIDTTLSDVRSYFEDQRPADIDELIKAFLLGCGLVDFDTVTKTKFVQSILELTFLNCDEGIGRTLLDWLQRLPDAIHGISQSTARRNVLTMLQRGIEAQIHNVKTIATASDEAKTEALQQIVSMLSKLVDLKQNNNIQNEIGTDILNLLGEKLTSMLESLVALGPKGLSAFFEIVKTLKTLSVEADEDIKAATENSWQHFAKLSAKVRKTLTKASYQNKLDDISPETGFAALIGLNLLEIYNGDTDAAEMLEELNSMADDFSNGKQEQVADNIVDTLMSLVSKPSKLNRRIGNLAFNGFATQLSTDGLKTLTDLVTTKETREGQQALFEHDGDLSDEADSSNEEDLDSDVDVLQASTSEVEDSADDESDNDKSSSTSDSDESDDELNSFESALAAALGTRKFTEADLNDAASNSGSDSSSASDSDMSDSEMMQLDDKLAEVFRNQAHQASAQKQRREEMKNAKENVVNLKNRAMDLIEIFLRTQQGRGMECVELVAALIGMAKETGTPQLATRGLDMVKTYVQRCKGVKLPTVPEGAGSRGMLKSKLAQLYAMVYDKDVSNAFIEVGAQVNILVCKLLSRAGEKSVANAVVQVSGVRGKRTEIKRKALQDFWSRFDAWAADNKQKEEPSRRETPVNGKRVSQSKQEMAKRDGKQQKTKK